MTELYSITRFTGTPYNGTRLYCILFAWHQIGLTFAEVFPQFYVPKLNNVAIVTGYTPYWRNNTGLPTTCSWSKSYNSERKSLQVNNTNENKRKNKARVISLWICIEGSQNLQWQNLYFIWRWDDIAMWRCWVFVRCAEQLFFESSIQTMFVFK